MQDINVVTQVDLVPKKPSHHQSSMTPRRLLLVLLAALCVDLSCSQSLRSAAVPPHLQTQDLCSNFVLICDFVAKNCNPNVKTQSWVKSPLPLHEKPKCVDSFNLFYQHNQTLSSCIQELPVDSKDKAQALVFLELYSDWQKGNACNTFHAAEAKAAKECSGVNYHRPWRQTAWPLYCHEVFTVYNNTRHELDQLCQRTPNSELFWEGYVNYIGSKTCKEYYGIVREARERGCAEVDKALKGTECREMFQWYVDNKEVVETDCYELKVSKSFYRGFYTWKKQQH
ncbi:hypothetical protein V7S43_012579 [Phytophthora oleae]|uniref:Uncharacterized protein n=1 Tax=Phytophthora oleae TaxID=2107226 RepID=A0ABD3F5W6_9STRA